MSSKEERPIGNSIKKRQKQAWDLRAQCFGTHVAANETDPAPAFFTAMLEYYSVLRPYLKSRDDMDEYWEEVEIEGLGEGLQSLDEWRFKTREGAVTNDDPGTGAKREIESNPDYLASDVCARVVDFLDEVTLELGFGADAKERTQKTKIDKEIVEDADQRAKEIIEEVSMNGSEG